MNEEYIKLILKNVEKMVIRCILYCYNMYIIYQISSKELNLDYSILMPLKYYKLDFEIVKKKLYQ